jgi:hypothetical protein
MAFGFGRGKGGRRGGGWKKIWNAPPSGRAGLGGPPAHCVCPRCGFVSPKEPGVPCFQKTCPQCGSPMAQQFVREK